jgi:hypothetical protein
MGVVLIGVRENRGEPILIPGSSAVLWTLPTWCDAG